MRAQKLAAELKIKSTAAAMPAVQNLGPGKWLADTGCGFDLVDKADVPDWAMQNFLTELAEPVVLNTANGQVVCDKTVSLQVGPLCQEIEPLILEDTPSVLSIGLRCFKMGYSFIWKPYKTPYFITPEGNVVKCALDGFCPFIVEDYYTACPATGSAPAPEVAADTWMTTATEVVRTHSKPREEMFVPGRNLPVNVKRLVGTRVTIATFADGSNKP